MNNSETTVFQKCALITGASSGIGRALVFEFIKDDYDIIAIGQNEKALTALKTQCYAEFKKSILVIRQDLIDENAVAHILRVIQENNAKIKCLVNNAGIGLWGEFSQTHIEDNLKLVQLHIAFYLKLTHSILLLMLENGFGEILNIGSVYSFAPVAKQSVYAATKAFMLSHTLALKEELKSKSISVSISCPGITETSFRRKMVENEKSSFLSMSAEAVARVTFKQFKVKKTIIIPGVWNKMYVFSKKIMPDVCYTILHQVLNKHRKLNNIQKDK